MNSINTLLLYLVAATPSRYAQEVQQLMELERADILRSENRVLEIRELRSRILARNTRYVRNAAVTLVVVCALLCLTPLLF